MRGIQLDGNIVAPAPPTVRAVPQHQPWVVSGVLYFEPLHAIRPIGEEVDRIELDAHSIEDLDAALDIDEHRLNIHFNVAPQPCKRLLRAIDVTVVTAHGNAYTMRKDLGEYLPEQQGIVFGVTISVRR